MTGLRTTSTLRLHRVVTLSTAGILCELGTLGPDIQAEVDAKLRALFDLT